MFPLLGIRFISLNNNYDSKEYIGKTMGLDMAINNLVNNLYSKDISKKLKSALKVKWKNGKWTGSKPPFGYYCSEDAYPVSVIEGHIWYSLKRILRILDSVQRESEEKYTDNSFTGAIGQIGYSGSRSAGPGI